MRQLEICYYPAKISDRKAPINNYCLKYLDVTIRMNNG